MTDHTLDARNLLCPMPVIKVQNAVRHFSVGDTLTVTCTDRGALYDIPAWCRIYQHPIIEMTENKHEIVFKIQVNRQHKVGESYHD